MQPLVQSAVGRGRALRWGAAAAWLVLLIGGSLSATTPIPSNADAAELFVQSDSYDRARGILPPQFIQHESRRFVVLSDAAPALARRQLELLERTHHQFQRFVGRMNISADPLRHKLVCVLFAQRPEYEAFAIEHDSISNRMISGYYSPRHDWIVFYNVHASPIVEQARYDLDAARRETERAATSMRSIALLDRRQLEQQRRFLDEFAEREAIATTVHECAHQLLFHTGVKAVQVQYPLWICEGLATCFETQHPQQAFGPDVEYAPRRERFDALLRDGGLLSLRELVGVNSIADETDEQRVQAIYHQSYALVAWLTRYRRDALRQYLITMRDHRAGRLDAPQHVELFAKAFGNIETLERTWLRHERTRAGIPTEPKLVQSPAPSP